MANVKEIMLRKYGPMPVWAWTGLAAAGMAGIMLWQKRSEPVIPSGGSTGQASGPAGEFQSSQSQTTTDKDGNQFTTNYAASGPLGGIPGYLTTQAGPMPYSGGDVYVNYPNQPPPQQTTNAEMANKRTQLNPDFNMVGWSDKDKQSPWKMMVAQPGERWEDLTARAYGFADNFAKVSDPAAKTRVQQVAAVIKDRNSRYTGTVPDGSGPTPGSVVLYR